MDNPVNGLSLSTLSPRDIAWQDKKKLNESVSQLYKNTQYHGHHERMCQCSNWLAFTQWVNGETGEAKLKLKDVRTCKVRHCPICSFCRSRVWKKRLTDGLAKLMVDHPNMRFLSLTLSVPNCHITELNDNINLMSKSWNRLKQHKDVKNVVVGYVRSLEVTRNPETGEAHPHFHILLAVKPSYFGKGYITQAQWVNHWKQSLGTTENRIVDIRTVKPNPKYKNDTNGLQGAILEFAKYCVKHTDMIVDQDWLVEMTTQLNATKHVVLGGLIKQYVNYKEPSEDDILKGDDDTEGLEEGESLFFLWNRVRRDYLLQNR